ncbi:MAG: rod shape-determining protein MreD [Thermoanaerobaculia bacterium]
MKALLRFIVGLALTVLVHLALVRWLPAAPRWADLFLVFLTYNAIGVSSLAGMAVGMVTGLAADAVSGNPFGLFGLAGTLLGYGIARLTQHIVIERAGSAFRLFVTSSVAHQALVVGLALLVLPQPKVPDWVAVLVRAASSGVLGVLVFGAGRSLRRRLGTWQQGRPSKVRWG